MITAGVVLICSAAFGATSALAGEDGENPNLYALSVEAAGLSVYLANDSLPLTNSIGASPYSALASLSSSGTSTAVGSAPYLGAFIQPLLSTVNGLGPGLLPPVPPVPGFVRSSYPTSPGSRQANGPYFISAESSADESTGTVRLGVSQAGSDDATIAAKAHVVAHADGSVVAAGSSSVDLLSFGKVLKIGSVRSSVTMTEHGSKAPKIETHTDVSAVTVLGVPVGLNEQGITVVGNDLSVPAASLNNTLNSALKYAGITVRYLPSTRTQDPYTKFVQSVDSGAVEVSVASPHVPGQGPYTLTFILGRMQVSAANTSMAGDPPGSDDTGTPPDPGTVDLPPTEGGTDAGGGLVSPPVRDLEPGVLSPEIPSPQVAGEETSSGGLQQNAHSGNARVMGLAVAGTVPDKSSQGIFLVLIMAGAAAILVANFARVFGVRRALS